MGRFRAFINTMLLTVWTCFMMLMIILWLQDPENIGLLIAIIVLVFMAAIYLLIFHPILVAPALNFKLTETEMVLEYYKKCKTIQCSTITEIIVTPLRYIICCDKKYGITRIIDKPSVKAYPFVFSAGYSETQKEIDPRIYEISDRLNIPIRKRQWP